MLTDVPSPLTSRPSGLDNYEFLEVLFTSKLSCISLNNNKKYTPSEIRTLAVVDTTEIILTLFQLC